MSRESVSPRLPEAVDFRFFGRKCKEILDDLVRVDSHRTPAEAANQFNELFHLAEENISLDKGMIESNMWAFAEELIDVAKEIPRDDSRVTRLISTIEELQRFPPKVVRVWGRERSVWTDLPLLRPCMRDNWEGAGQADDETPDDSRIPEWISLNSFAARLLGKRLVETSWDYFAIWQLRDALEEAASPGPLMNAEVSAATEWIIHAGEVLFHLLTDDLNPDRARMTRPGSLYPGKAGLCRERWDFWKMRFSKISEQVDKDTGERASRAAQKMKEIEG